MSAAAFRRQVSVFIDRSLSQEAQAQRLAQAAQAGVAELVASGRASPRYRRYVDGQEGLPETAVKAGGTIAYRFTYAADVVTFALEFLRRRAPVASGAYRDAFYLGVDGTFVRASSFDADRIGDPAEVVIGNTLPYSRKVDVQLVGGRRMRFSVPAGIMDDAVRALRARFGNIVVARRFSTMRFPGQETLKAGLKAGRPVESPAVVISFPR